ARVALELELAGDRPLGEVPPRHEGVAAPDGLLAEDRPQVARVRGPVEGAEAVRFQGGYGGVARGDVDGLARCAPRLRRLQLALPLAEVLDVVAEVEGHVRADEV